MILFGEGLFRTLAEFSAHYHGERNHQGKGNKFLVPDAADKPNSAARAVECRQRLGGLLKFYCRMNSLTIRPLGPESKTRVKRAQCGPPVPSPQ